MTKLEKLKNGISKWGLGKWRGEEEGEGGRRRREEERGGVGGSGEEEGLRLGIYL